MKDRADNATARSDRLLALIMLDGMGGAPKQEKALRLARVGFTPAEIASLLGTRVATVNLQLYRAQLNGRHRTPARPKRSA